jgi:DNA helicase HerA-like ATPase
LEGGLERFLAAARGERGEWASRVAARLREAYRLAESLGRLVGRVSRFREVKTTFTPEIEVEVDPGVYYSSGGLRVGDFLAVVDPKTLKVQLGVIVEVVRADELAGLGDRDRPISPFTGAGDPDPHAIMTTAVVRLRLLVEGSHSGSEAPVPASTSVDPQSPVVDPEPWVVEKLLSLNVDGVTLGALATPGGPVKGGRVAVKLPYKSLLEHVLVIGTTGSGKTTLLKNMISSLLSGGGEFVPVALDMNQDFVQLPLPGPGIRGDPAEHVYRGVSPPSRAVIVLPTPVSVVDEAFSSMGSGGSLLAVAETVVSEYSAETLEPLTGRRGSWKCRVRAGAAVVCESPEMPYTVIPYTISTVDPRSMGGDALAGLMPGATPLAQDLLKRVREVYRRESPSGLYPPLQALLAGVAAYLESLGARGRGREDVEALAEQVDLVAPLVAGERGDDKFYSQRPLEPGGETIEQSAARVMEALARARPHRGTVEALYRKLQALAEAGVVDVALSLPGDPGRVVLLPEPPWSLIVDEAVSGGRVSPIVVDLAWAFARSGGSMWAPRLVAYRALERLIAWKQSEWASRRVVRKILVIVDEAHQFFPQEKGLKEEAEANRRVASMIARIARLGRARGVGIVFSTHSPSDLHDIILQLANTKIVLRTERSHAEKVGVPAELRDMVPYLADRYMVVMSHVYRGGYVMAVTSRPITMHYDVSHLSGP